VWIRLNDYLWLLWRQWALFTKGLVLFRSWTLFHPQLQGWLLSRLDRALKWLRRLCKLIRSLSSYQFSWSASIATALDKILVFLVLLFVSITVVGNATCWGLFTSLESQDGIGLLLHLHLSLLLLHDALSVASLFMFDFGTSKVLKWGELVQLLSVKIVSRSRIRLSSLTFVCKASGTHVALESWRLL